MHRTALGAVQVSNRIIREIATPRLRSGQAVPLAVGSGILAITLRRAAGL